MTSTAYDDQFAPEPTPAEEEAWRELEQRQGKQSGGGADSPNAWVIEADRLVCAFVKAELGRDNSARQAAAEAMRKHLLLHPAAQGQDAEPVLPLALKTHSAWDGLEGLDELPDGTEIYAHPPSAKAEPLHITHGPLMREAAALLRLRKPVHPGFERVAAKLEAAIDGRPTPAGAPSQEWLDVAAAAEADHFRDATKMVSAEPVSGADGLPIAVLRFERGTPGQENEMPRVVSCNWLPDGEYKVYLRPAQPSGNAGELPQAVITLTGAQLLQALNYVSPDHETFPDQLESEASISYGDGHSGKGYYCWYSDLPEEGAILLDAEAQDAQAQPPVSLPVDDERAACDDAVLEHLGPAALAEQESPRPSWLDGGEDAVSMAIEDALNDAGAPTCDDKGAQLDIVGRIAALAQQASGRDREDAAYQRGLRDGRREGDDFIKGCLV